MGAVIGFVVGLVVGAFVMFLVYRNNQKKFNEAVESLKQTGKSAEEIVEQIKRIVK